MPRALRFIPIVVLGLTALAAAVHYKRIDAFGALAAFVGGSIAVANYTRSVKIKRLDWLLQLFQRYMDQKKFRRIRYLVVFRVQPEYGQLRELMEHRAERRVDQDVASLENSLIMDMDDYLNYFELIATLWTKGELELGEIKMLYHDYIKYLWQIDFTHAYITKWGFESLTRLATKLFGPRPLRDNPAPTKVAAGG